VEPPSTSCLSSARMLLARPTSGTFVAR
jgi:hypothetical protein